MKLIKIPSSQGGLGKADGAEKAPDEVMKRLDEVYLSEDGIKPVFDIDSVEIVENNIEKTNENILQTAKKAFSESDKCAFIGGDHSVTYPLVQAFSEVHENPGIIIFDAHPDCTNDFLPATQEDIVNSIVNNGLIKPENVILVGIRSIDTVELQFLKEKRIKYYSMKEISVEGVHNVCDAVMAAAKDFRSLYISVDIDVVDPAFAPGTGYIEPAGMTSRELLYFLQRIKILRNYKSMDLVEINPEKDVNGITAKLGAKILVEMS